MPENFEKSKLFEKLSLRTIEAPTPQASFL
jgi:hypothetical protein